MYSVQPQGIYWINTRREAEKERNESGADRKKERIIAFPLGKEIPKNRGFVCHSFYLLTKIVV